MLDPRVLAASKEFLEKMPIYKVIKKDFENPLVQKIEKLLKYDIIILKKEEIRKYFDKPDKVGILEYKIDNKKIIIEGISRKIKMEGNELYILVHSHEVSEELSLKDRITMSRLKNIVMGVYIIKKEKLILYFTPSTKREIYL